MRLTLRNLLEWLDQTGWNRSNVDSLREIVREPQRARRWIERLQAMRDNRSVSNRLEDILDNEIANDSNANSISGYIDRNIDSDRASELEQRVLRNDVLLKDLIVSHLAARHATRNSAAVTAELRQAVYSIGNGNDSKQTERVKRFSGDLPFVDREVAPAKDDLDEYEEEFVDDLPAGNGKPEPDNSDDLDETVRHERVSEAESEPNDEAVPGESHGKIAVVAAGRKTWWPLMVTLLIAAIGVASFFAGLAIANWGYPRGPNPNLTVNRPDSNTELANQEESKPDDNSSEIVENETSSESGAESDSDSKVSNDDAVDDPSGKSSDLAGNEGGPADPKTGDAKAGDSKLGDVAIQQPDRPDTDDLNSSDNVNDKKVVDEDVPAGEGDAKTNEGVADSGQAEKTTDEEGAGESNETDLPKLGEQVAKIVSQNEQLAYLGGMELAEPAAAPESELETDESQDNTDSSAEISPNDPQKGDAHVGKLFLASSVTTTRKNAPKKIEGTEWLVADRGLAIRENHRLFILNAFRPQIEFDDSCKVEFIGPAFVNIGASSEFGFELRSGRAIVSATNVQQTIEVTTRAGLCRVEMTEDFAELAIESRAYFEPGSELIDDNERSIVQMLVLKGSCKFTFADQEEADREYSLTAGQAVSIVISHKAGEPASLLKIPGQFSGLPDWVRRAPGGWDEIAREQLAKELNADQPLVQQLDSLMDHERDEVRAASLQNLIALGRFQFVIDFFDAPRYRIFWTDMLATVRYVMQQDLQHPQSMKTSLSITGSRSADFYQLLIGYGVETIDQKVDNAKQSPLGAKLVEWLDDPRLAIRVLAIENLRSITGSTHLYRPDVDRRRRKQKIKKWEQVDIKYVSAYDAGLLKLEPIKRIEEDESIQEEPDNRDDEADLGDDDGDDGF